MTQIKAQPVYVNDPTKSRALFNASLFFGLPDEDPQIPANQKLVKALQENGSLVTLTQPVATNSGGNPVFQGSPVVLEVDGDYSYKALNSSGTQVIFIPRVSNPADESVGFSGVVVTEQVTLSSPGQTTVVLSNLGAQESVFYLITSVGDQGVLAKTTDYTVTDSVTIELTQSYNVGDVILARQNDPTGQLIPINEDAAALLVFDDATAAQSSAVSGNLVAGQTLTLNGNAAAGDGLGGDKYLVIVTAFSNDDVNFIDLNGTLQLALSNNYYRFQNYSETIDTALISATVLNMDLDGGVNQTIVIDENASSVAFVNFNPDNSFTSTVTLKVTQDGVGGWGITWPAIIKWAGGVAPTLTATANAVDIFGFVTYDAGVTWLGFTLGQDIK